MKKGFMFTAMAILSIVGCQKTTIDNFIREAKSFVAVTENYDSETKTTLGEDGNVLWKKGDQVSIFAGSTNNEQYQVSDASDGKTSASMERVSTPGFVGGGEISNNVAYYPYSVSHSLLKNGVGYKLAVTLPATQEYARDSFGNGAFPMAAVTGSASDMTLKFKNILGGLKLQLKGSANIVSISITGNNGELLCGSADVIVSTDAAPSLVLNDDSATTVTLNCGGIELNESVATSFVIALPPVTMSTGFTVVVTDADGKSMEIKTEKSQVITRSSVLRMPVVSYVGVENEVDHEYVDLGLSVKWAKCNVGADKETDYGSYFSWGETEEKEAYWWSTYKWGDRYNGGITKYNGADNLFILEHDDDAASVNWGDDWRTPTFEEMMDLVRNCEWEWITNNGVKGCRITSKVNGFEDNSIFLPAARSRYGEDKFYGIYDYGSYWTSINASTAPNYERTLEFYFESAYVSQTSVSTLDRYYGLPVRPVHD